MRLFSKEATGYAVLLILLFSIAAIAVWYVLDFLQTRVAVEDYGVVAILVGTITLGFMLIAGAFGLWAIQFAGVAEGVRRVGRLVEAMDYIQDGVLAVDIKARITGSNPAVRRISGQDLGIKTPLQTVFPCLTDADVALILESKDPCEVERKLTVSGLNRSLRFRSQPLEGFSLLLVSDVTSMEARRTHSRQVARLQLIGQIARGVAYDFNNILCAVAGHASLLTRLPPGSPEVSASVLAINKGAERGTKLAAHLLELSTPGMDNAVPRMSTEYLQAAASALRDSLSELWALEAQIETVPPLSLSGIKIEQIVLNLGLLAADRASAPGTLRIIASTPRAEPPMLNVGHQFAGVIVVAAAPMETAVSTPASEDSSPAGVIVSVIRSMIEEANGALDSFRAMDGSPIYRVSLPLENIAGPSGGRDRYGAELGPYVANWSVLVVASPERARHTMERLRALSVRLERVDDFVSALTRMEGATPPDAILLDQRLAASEEKGLLRAVVKLCPTAAVVVLADHVAAESATQLASDVVFIPHALAAERILMAMIEARSLAVKRRTS